MYNFIYSKIIVLSFFVDDLCVELIVNVYVFKQIVLTFSQVSQNPFVKVLNCFANTE
jgi:hypothetical protein